jgi:hypothetical protein
VNPEIKLLKDTAGIDLAYAFDLIKRFETAERAIEHLCSLETSPPVKGDGQ